MGKGIGMRVRKLVARVYEVVVNRTVKDMIQGKLIIKRIKCRYCNSDTVWLYGKNRSGVQRFKCSVCGKVFLEKDTLPSMRVSVRQLGDVIGQYYGGMSLKELRRQFEQQHNKNLSRSSFDRWLRKFSKIAITEAGKYHPKVSGKWLADECVLKIGGKNVWCWDIIDSETRFLLATHLSLTRTTQDARKLMQKALKVSGTVPSVILTDSLRAYIDGIELVFGGYTKHIQSQPFASADLSTNKIERWHSTLRTRMDILRGFNNLKSAQSLLDGWLVHYNFFRTHESLEDRTPADVAGIKFPYKNWLDVVEAQRVTIEPETIASEDELQNTYIYKAPAQITKIERTSKKTTRISERNMRSNTTTLKGIRR
jgi:transposase-like protein/ribosomal protein S27E